LRLIDKPEKGSENEFSGGFHPRQSVIFKGAVPSKRLCAAELWRVGDCSEDVMEIEAGAVELESFDAMLHR